MSKSNIITFPIKKKKINQSKEIKFLKKIPPPSQIATSPSTSIGGIELTKSIGFASLLYKKKNLGKFPFKKEKKSSYLWCYRAIDSVT
jgi:hypothetical protein